MNKFQHCFFWVSANIIQLIIYYQYIPSEFVTKVTLTFFLYSEPVFSQISFHMRIVVVILVKVMDHALKESTASNVFGTQDTMARIAKLVSDTQDCFKPCNVFSISEYSNQLFCSNMI